MAPADPPKDDTTQAVRIEGGSRRAAFQAAREFGVPHLGLRPAGKRVLKLKRRSSRGRRGAAVRFVNTIDAGGATP